MGAGERPTGWLEPQYFVLFMALVILFAGCTDSSELSGTRLPNSMPDTRITGEPNLLEASFVVGLNWMGSDEDGFVAGYEWRVSNNGNDGISPRDTLTVDPLTGAVLHPWRYTDLNDTTLVLLADQPGFPGDDPSKPRSFRTHSFFIRAVDDKGAVDPSPAYITFTSTTIVPTCRVVYPNLSRNLFKSVPESVNLGWEGVDPDFELKVPTQMRFLWKSAQFDTTDLGEPRYIRTLFEYNLHYDEVLDFDDPEWSEWRSFYPSGNDRRLRLTDLPNGEFFLFAIQVRDTAGAVSIGMEYQKEVANVKIVHGGFFPAVEVSDPLLGSTVFSETSDKIASDQPLNFRWTASAASYNGDIVSYRHGWDLIDPDDPNDPGWAVPPGVSSLNMYARERSYQNGFHTFFLRVEDNAKQVRLVKWGLEVLPVSGVSQP